MNRLLERYVNGEFKTTCRNVLASIEGEKKPFYYFFTTFFDQNIANWSLKIGTVLGYKHCVLVHVESPLFYPHKVIGRNWTVRTPRSQCVASNDKVQTFQLIS